MENEALLKEINNNLQKIFNAIQDSTSARAQNFTRLDANLKEKFEELKREISNLRQKG
jgi:hypothetical protein